MRLLRTIALAALAALAFAAPARATPVLVLHGSHVTRRDDPYLPRVDLTPVASEPGKRGRARLERRAGRRAKPPAITGEALGALRAQGLISDPEYSARLAAYDDARLAARRLSGTRRAELEAVIANVDSMASSGQLTPERLEPVFMTLERNRQWWTTAPLPGAHERVAFSGSMLVWEYYPGQGIELQMLGNFGKANALWSAGANDSLRALLDELVPLAATRAGAPAWEYYFEFDGGAPPWTSGLSQGTAVQVLARASRRFGDQALRDLGQRALGVFAQSPPEGVRVHTANGSHYLIYSFAPRTFVLNAFLQALIGLSDFASLTGDPTARMLYESGDSEARAAVPRYDTGAWSLYSLGQESDLNYHELVTGFLQNLCKRTHDAVYCDHANRMRSYLKIAPAIAIDTSKIRAGRRARLGFELSKISHVKVSVRSAGRIVFSVSELVGYGRHRVSWPMPRRAGTYELRLVATDLAGNRAQASRPLLVLSAKKQLKRPKQPLRIGRPRRPRGATPRRGIRNPRNV